MRITALLILLTLSFMPLHIRPAQAATDAEIGVRTKLENMLGDIKVTPTCEQWAADKSVAIKFLSEKLDSATVAPALRMRAAYALGCFHEAAAGAALLKVLHNPKTPLLISRPALHSYALSQGEKALPEIKKALASRDIQTRVAAVESAALIKGKGAKDLLREHAKTEKFPMILTRIKEILGDDAGK